jgi:CopG family nickel-responsive transcriptional regulator
MRVSLDHETCMKVSVLRGKTAEVESFAGHVSAERGVKHGQSPSSLPRSRTSITHTAMAVRTHQHVRVR